MTTVLRNPIKAVIEEMQQAYRRIRGSDHRLLNHYILKINQLQDLDSILYHASRCLQHLLAYRFFAFAMYDREYNGGIDIWIDPQVDNLSVTHCIKKDFDIPDAYCNVHYFEDGGGQARAQCDMTGMTAQDVLVGQTRARLYVIPLRPLRRYQHELIRVLMQSIATAILHFINVKKLENAALIDPLTHCYNRRALDDSLAHDMASAERYGSDLSLVMFDIDFFKRINDTHGHKAGDAVLRAVAKSVLAAIRKSDYLARYGGEEFVLVLPETKFSKAIELAERLRKIIQHTSIRCAGSVLGVTASFGVAAYKPGMDKEGFLHKADEMLYEAKRQGRNRIKPDLKVYQRQQPLSLSVEEPAR